MKAFLFFLPIVGWFWLVGCSPVKTTISAIEPSFSLSNYSSFAFHETSAAGDLSTNYQLHLGFLKSEISKHMAYRGLLPAPNGDADLLINIGILVENQTQTRETGLLTDPGTFNYIGQRRYTWKSETVEVGHYRKGAVDLHLIDAASNKAVWVGVTSGVIDENSEKILDTISRGVDKMFEKL